MNKLYMIGNTHFDPVWLWKWDEAMSSITATFRSALERMTEYSEFIYSFTTPPVFEWIKQTSPEMFEQIKARVAEGRWELAEGWWVQPDCYSASGESYVRQGLYGQRYLKENFGKYSNTVFNIDSFGHNVMLPQILLKTGISNYVFVRPEAKHCLLEKPLFYWQSPDGSKVKTYRVSEPYVYDNFSTRDALDKAKNDKEDVMLVYGVTDHGGAPTKQSLEDIRKEERAFCTTLEKYFDDHTPEITLKNEFVTGDFGPYSNCTHIKALNRIAEYAVLNAEKVSVISGEYDCEAINKCWQDILFNQFHDILGGASIKDAYFDAENLHGRAISVCNEMIYYKLQKITNNIKMPGENPETAWNIAVWNLNAFEFCGYVEAEVQWLHEFKQYRDGIALADEDGNIYPCQIIREKSVIPGFRSRFVFKAEIPALGYKAFRVIQTKEEIYKENINDYTKIETNKYIVCLDENNGGIKSITLKESGKVVGKNLLNPMCYIDDGDTWAFNTDGYGTECEKFEFKGFKVIESGKLRTVLKFSYIFRSSMLDYYYTFYKAEDYIDVKYKVNWNEGHIAFKLLCDTNDNCHTASTPYGKVSRGETVRDNPVGEWLNAGGLSFAMDNIFAYNLTGGKIGFTVLRSPIYGDLRIEEIDLDTDFDITEQGIKEGNIRVYINEKKAIEKEAMAFNNPPVVLCEACHDGKLPGVNSYINYNSENIIITVIKSCEDDDSVIIRGYEAKSKAEEFSFSFEGKRYTTDIKPLEIFTLKISEGKCFKVNMLEENSEDI